MHCGRNATYQDERQGLDPACEGPFQADDIAELADRQWLRDCAGCGEGVWKLVEPVRNGGILHEIALMKNIRSSGRDLHNYFIGVVGRNGCCEGHALEKVGDLFCVQRKAST